MMELQTLLFELGVEELPHALVEKGEKMLKELFQRTFSKQKVTFTECLSFSTPRRLAVRIAGLPEALAAEAFLKKGPKLPGELATLDESVNERALAKLLATHSAFLKALTGFCKANGLQTDGPPEKLSKHFPLGAWKAGTAMKGASGQLYWKDFNGHPFVVIPVRQEALTLMELLPRLFKEIMEQLEFGETMRWGAYKELEGDKEAKTGDLKNSRQPLAFPRPIRYLTILLNDTVVPFQWGGVRSGRVTRGHAWLTESDDLRGKALTVSHSDQWEELLAKHFVMANSAKRRAFILKELQALEAKHGWEIVQLRLVLNIVNNLVEFPELIVGTFDEAFLKLPEEVIISEMVEHQKYFPIRDKQTQKLLPRFVITSNIRTRSNSSSSTSVVASKQGMKQVNFVQMGNERVLTARLRDGVFFYEQDLKLGLLNMYPRLAKIIFSEELGSYADKMERVRSVLLFLNAYFGLKRTPEELTLLAKLAKADLASRMVVEFPELQGIIGEYYARAANIESEMTRALREQYMGGNKLPETRLGFLLVLSEKLVDSVGLFSGGVKASGSEDPYGLRRASLLMARLLIKRGHFFAFKHFFENNEMLYQPFLKQNTAKNLFQDLIAFLNARLKTVLKGLFLEEVVAMNARNGSTGIRTEDKELSYQLAAVLEDDDWNPLRSWLTLRTVAYVIRKHSEQFKAILQMYKRMSHILEGQQDFLQGAKTQTLAALESSLRVNRFEKDEETTLFAKYQMLKEEVKAGREQMMSNGKNTEPEKLSLLILCFYECTQPLENFFEAVMVNVETVILKRNRLTLLLLVRRTMEQVLSWKKIPILESLK